MGSKGGIWVCADSMVPQLSRMVSGAVLNWIDPLVKMMYVFCGELFIIHPTVFFCCSYFLKIYIICLVSCHAIKCVACSQSNIRLFLFFFCCFFFPSCSHLFLFFALFFFLFRSIINTPNFSLNLHARTLTYIQTFTHIYKHTGLGQRCSLFCM